MTSTTTGTDKEVVEDSKWLSAHYDPVANIYTFSSCMALADLAGDGEYNMLVADLGNCKKDIKLKVYRGINLQTHHPLLDLPSSITSFYMDENEPRVPGIAVASGPYIFVYKNLKPYFKFSLPLCEVNTSEAELWNLYREERMSTGVLRDRLEELRNTGTSNLTVRSQKFIMLHPADTDDFAKLYKEVPLKRQTVITCMTTIYRNIADDRAINSLIVGTENQQVYIMDSEAFTIIYKAKLRSVPVFLSANGIFDVDFRVVVACRDGRLYSLRRGVDEAKQFADVGSQIVGLERLQKQFYVGCVDNNLVSLTTKGRRLWVVYLPASITAMCAMENEQRGIRGVLVALANNRVHMYRDKHCLHVLHTAGAVTAIRYGPYGREAGGLVMFNSNGALIVKLLKRTATFDEHQQCIGPPKEQSVRLNVPKKTTLFIEQTKRERENALLMHRVFQQDLARITLITGKEYLRALRSSQSPISSNPNEPVRFNAQVQGIGPAFKLIVVLQNTSTSRPIVNLFITFQYDDSLYRVARNNIDVPILVPGVEAKLDTLVECLSDKGISDDIKVFVCKENYLSPLVMGMVSMPVSEGLLLS